MITPDVAVALELDEVSKAYPGVRALDRVSLTLRAGEIHGIVGENGAGKSTLVNVVAGAVAPDGGEIRLAGQRVQLAGPWDARRQGIAIVHQEFQSLLALSVAENVLLGSETMHRRFINWGASRRQAEAAFQQIGVAVDVRATMESLGPAQRKLVEIARAVHARSAVLILDEPTAALEADDSERLYASMAALREAGVALGFISHRLDEVLRVCDRVTVLRDGRVVGSWPVAELTIDALIEHMVGRRVDTFFAEHPVPAGEPLLSVRELTVDGAVHGVSLDVGRGEIVGLAGLLGSGRTELAQAIYGAIRHQHGSVTLAGQPFSCRSPNEAVRAGICYVPANRQQDGIVFTLDVGANLSLGVLRQLRSNRLLDKRRERRLGEELITRIRIVTRSLRDEVETLSGGNQQKILLGRWLAAEPSVLILDEPTQGIDVGAKAEIHRLIAELAAGGLAILLITSDLQELVKMSDRVIVMHRGRVVRELIRGEITEEAVIAHAAGVMAAVVGA